uniref:Uncharacterized protein n=1 Tax=Pseudomonas phage vB_PaeS_HTN2 TaxID=3236647 RepID=A0AB39AI91_9VIRU
MAKLTHTNIASNAWAFYAEDVMVRVEAMQAEEERQMRECLGNRDNYDLQGIKDVIAYHEKNGLTRRANIARVMLAQRLAQVDDTMAKLVELHAKWSQGDDRELVNLALQSINQYTSVLLADKAKVASVAVLDEKHEVVFYLTRHGYTASVRATDRQVVVMDPVHSNGNIVGHRQVTIRNMASAVRFTEERS